MSQTLAQSLESAIEQGTFPGAVALVSLDGKILFHEARGHAALVPVQRTLKRTTLFDIASLTKVAATTTAIMLLFEEGCLDLSDKVIRFVPEFGQQGKDSITIAHLMTHSSGLPAWMPFYETIENSVEATLSRSSCETPTETASKAQVYARIHVSGLEYAPGTKTVYSDLGFILLGEIIERISGDTLDGFVQDRIFDRLGMTSSFYNRDHVSSIYPPEGFAATELCPERGGVSCGQVHDENAYFMGGVAGHAGMFSTAYDLSIFVQTLLDALDGKSEFLSQGTVERFVTRANVVEGSSRAFGWDTPSMPSSSGQYFSQRSFGHTGFTGTSIWADRERRLFAILLTNRVHPTRENVQIVKFRPYFHDLVMSLVMED